MRGARRLRSILVIALLLSSVVGAQAPKPARPAAKPAPMPVSAIVTDSKGATAVVDDFKARYGYNPNRQGVDPILRDVSTLSLLLTQREGRVTTNDRIELPFAGLRRIAFRGGEHALEIERQDGGRILVDQARGNESTVDVAWILQEKTPTGEVVRRLGLKAYEPGVFVEDGKLLDAAIMRQLELFGFLGRAKTSSGQVGDFFIATYEVRAIEFK